MGIRRFLYVSSIAFYDWSLSNRSERSVSGSLSETYNRAGESGDSGPPLEIARSTNSHQRSFVTENHPVSLPSHYAKSKYEGEQLVSSSPLDWRIVRLATVFGEGDRANFSRMSNAMRRHLFPIPGRGSARKSVIPVNLAAELIAQFTLMGSPPHRLINLGLPTAPNLREIADSYHEICGLPKCPTIPMPLATGLGICGDIAARLLGKFPFTTETLKKLTTTSEVSVERMLECFPNREFSSFEKYLAECKGWYSSSKS